MFITTEIQFYVFFYFFFCGGGGGGEHYRVIMPKVTERMHKVILDPII